MAYNPGRDLVWLMLRPWVAVPRLIQVLWSLSGLILVLLVRSGSPDATVQQGLARPDRGADKVFRPQPIPCRIHETGIVPMGPLTDCRASGKRASQ